MRIPTHSGRNILFREPLTAPLRTAGAALLLLPLFLGTTGLAGYDGLCFSPSVLNPKIDKFQLVDGKSGKKSQCLWLGEPKLTQQWKRLSFVLTAEGDGLVWLRFGPSGKNDIPIYFDDFMVNGVPLSNGGFEQGAQDWNLCQEAAVASAPGVAAVGNSCLRLFHSEAQGAWRSFAAKQGERLEVSLMARTGSALEAFPEELSTARENLRLAIKSGGAARTATPRELSRSVNELIGLMARHPHVTVSPLAPDAVSPAAAQDKLLELTKACDTEMARTAKDEIPCLYNEPKVFDALKSKLAQVTLLSAKLKTDCLMALIFDKK